MNREKRHRQLAADETREGYDRWSRRYDVDPNPMVAATTWALETAPLDCVDGDVVELGCGTGRFASRILAAGARSYTGVDTSAGMLERAHQVRDPRVRWLQGEICCAPLPDGCADVVLIVLVLEHLRDTRALFSEVARILRSKGVLRIADIHPELVARGTVAHFWDGGEENRFTSFAHSLESLRSELTHAGLTVERLTSYSADDGLIGVAPQLAKHRGLPVLIDLVATR